MRKVRVLLCINHLDLGGEKSILVHSKYFDKSQFEVFACSRLGGGRRVPEFEKYGIPVFVGPLNIDDLLEELKIDVYHVFRSGDYEEGSLPQRQSRHLRIVETNIFRAYDFVENQLIDCHLFPSDHCKDRYYADYGFSSKKRYETLYHPIDFDEFHQHQKTFSATFGRVSRPDDYKWHKICLKVIPKVYKKVPESQCLIMGISEQKRTLLDSLGLAKRVQLFDTSLDVASFYRRLDVFTHGSRVGETFGCVIAEAMANRLPVVTVSTPQRKKSNAQIELVEDGDTGFVRQFGWSYANAVVELLQNEPLRVKMGRRGYEKAREQFEASRVTRKLEQIYRDVLDMPK